MLYRSAKKSGSRRALKKIKRIRDKSSKKRYDSNSDESYSDVFLSRNIDLDKYRHPGVRREINLLYHVVTDNIKTNKYQRNDAIENEPKFDSSFNFLAGLKTLYQ